MSAVPITVEEIIACRELLALLMRHRWPELHKLSAARVPELPEDQRQMAQFAVDIFAIYAEAHRALHGIGPWAELAMYELGEE